MQFQIKCSTFVRFAAICSFFEPECDEETRAEINTVRLEIKNGRFFVIATNQKIAAVEFLGNIASPDSVAHVVLDKQLIEQCKAESFLDGWLTINTIPEIATAMAQTTSGWSFQGNACHWFDNPIIDEWRDWAPDAPPSKSEGIMMWNLHHVQTLLESSPSGEVIFPEFIDSKTPVVLRDRNDPNWVGLFIPKPNGDVIKKPAMVPDWWRK